MTHSYWGFYIIKCHFIVQNSHCKSVINLKCMLAFYYNLFFHAFRLKEGDIESIPGPKKGSICTFPTVKGIVKVTSTTKLFFAIK